MRREEEILYQNLGLRMKDPLLLPEWDGESFEEKRDLAGRVVGY